jgi:hypothetical protein
VYEHEALPQSEIKPDPPVLRMAYAWTSMFKSGTMLWDLVLAAQDVTDAEGTLKELRTLATFIKNDLEDIGLDMDPKIALAYSMLGKFCTGLPANENDLLALEPEALIALARAKSAYMSSINTIIISIHRNSSFGDIEFDEDQLRIERSREMLKRINSSKPSKTIYKVGDDHVTDMKTRGMEQVAGVLVLSKSEYVPEFNAILPAAGGRAVFNNISEDML